MNKLKLARDLAETEPDEALRLCNEVLNDEIDSDEAYLALFISGFILMEAEKHGLAFHMFKKCLDRHPNRAEIWLNMGMCLADEFAERSKEYFHKAIELDPKNEKAYANLGLAYLNTGEPKKGIQASQKALQIDPEMRAAKHNIGLMKIMLRDWSGWDEYKDCLGVRGREAKDYGYPNWNGEKGTVLVYGEQGVGDEIMFASCLEDLSKTNEIIFDCDKRLESIFKRAFPNIEIHGERFSDEPLRLSKEPDYQLAIGQLPAFYRKKDQDFPGKPYLTPCPERKTQWASILKDKPRVGIAWRGGLKSTLEANRSTELDTFAPLFDLDAQFINLEYKPVDQGVLNKYEVDSWDRAVRKGCDLEDTLALISNLDCVVTVCTTVVYLAGSLGIPCYVLVPEKPGYRYHIKGRSFPWFECVKLYRGQFNQSIMEIKSNVKNIHRIRSKGDSSIPCAV